MAQNLLLNHTKDFWADVRKYTKPKNTLATSIDGVVGEKEVSNHWRNHYKQVYNSVPKKGAYVHPNFDSHDNPVITAEEVAIAIKAQKNDKAIGPDGVSAEHIKYCSPIINEILANLFTMILSHGIIPQKMLSAIIKPIIKDSKGKLNCGSNYRPIAVSTIFSKILETVFLNRIKPMLESSDNQFGFKENLGTDSCIFVLKEAIAKLSNANSNVFISFLDASKAFDRVEHYTLFKKLEKRGIPSPILRVLSYWYEQQTSTVAWGNSFSEPFSCGNGVKQGGVLSPYFFNVYTDDLSRELNREAVGCEISGQKINHLCYADDITLISPSPSGLKRLLKVCEKYAIEHEILFNPIKSKVMIFRSRDYRNAVFPEFHLNDQQISLCKQTKYLGHIICDDRSDDADIMRQCRYIYAVGNTLIKRLSFCSAFIKKKLFRTYFSNFYTCQLWYSYKRASINKVKVAYNSMFRRLLGVPRYVEGQGNYSASNLFVTNNITTFDALLRKRAYSFKVRHELAENRYLCAIGSNRFAYTYMWQVWEPRLRPP